MLGLCLLFPSLAHAAPAGRGASDKLSFDVPAGDARPMLRRFASQANREILFPVDDVDGIRTNPIKGELTIPEALELMLADTGLIATYDAKTGAIAIRNAVEGQKTKRPLSGPGGRAWPPAEKESPDPNDYRAALTASDRPALQHQPQPPRNRQEL